MAPERFRPPQRPLFTFPRGNPAVGGGLSSLAKRYKFACGAGVSALLLREISPKLVLARTRGEKSPRLTQLRTDTRACARPSVVRPVGFEADA